MSSGAAVNAYPPATLGQWKRIDEDRGTGGVEKLTVCETLAVSSSGAFASRSLPAPSTRTSGFHWEGCCLGLRPRPLLNEQSINLLF
jgi:hypothetical protein